jgi:hypothetical protein
LVNFFFFIMLLEKKPLGDGIIRNTCISFPPENARIISEVLNLIFYS